MYYTPPTTDYGRAMMQGHMNNTSVQTGTEPINDRDGPGGGVRRLLGRGLITLGTRLVYGTRTTVPS